MWEQDPQPLLADSALLPLAALAQTDSPRALLERVATQVANIESTDQQQNVSACVQMLAGLRFEKNLIRQLFREEIMRESVIYQDILQKGLQQGLQQGKQEGELAVVLRQLTRRIGTVDTGVQERLRGLSTFELEDLAEALLDFSDATDLANWLRDRSV
jgi:predicted transposase YdaD